MTAPSSIDLPSTETTSHDPKIKHWVCGTCFPTKEPPVFAVCGYLISQYGLTAQQDKERSLCPVCAEIGTWCVTCRGPRV